MNSGELIFNPRLDGSKTGCNPHASFGESEAKTIIKLSSYIKPTMSYIESRPAVG